MQSKYAVQRYCAHCRSYHAVKDIKIFLWIKNPAQISPYPSFYFTSGEKLAIHLDNQFSNLSTNLFGSNKLRSQGHD